MTRAIDTTNLTIISGAQIGADRGALKAAKACEVKTMGFAPNGFKTDDQYPPEKLVEKYNIQECAEPGFRIKDEMNANQSNGLVAFRINKPLSGKGTEQTIYYFLHGERAPNDFVVPQKATSEDVELRLGKKPVLLIWDVHQIVQDPTKLEDIACRVAEFINQNNISKLMVAGPVDQKNEDGVFDKIYTKSVKELFVKVFAKNDNH